MVWGKKNGFDLNYYKGRGLTVPFSPAAIISLSTQKTGSWKKEGQNLGVSFLISIQHNNYLDQRKMTCAITQSRYYDNKYSNSYELSLQSLGSPWSALEGKASWQWGFRPGTCRSVHALFALHGLLAASPQLVRQSRVSAGPRWRYNGSINIRCAWWACWFMESVSEKGQDGALQQHFQVKVTRSHLG